MDETDLLAEERTELALKRTMLAYERTLSAWLRTGIAALAAGLGLPQLIRYNDIPWLIQGAAFVLILLSLESFFLGIWGYRQGLNSLSGRNLLPLRWLFAVMFLLLVISALLALIILFT